MKKVFIELPTFKKPKKLKRKYKIEFQKDLNDGFYTLVVNKSTLPNITNTKNCII